MAPYSSRMAFPTTVLAVNTVGIALSFLVVVLRTYARLSRNIKFRLCDYTIIASWVFGLATVISENYCVTRGGIGQDTALVTVEELLFATKQFIVIGVTGTLAVTFVKISLLDFLLSIFSIQRTFGVVAYLLMAITMAYGLSFTIVTLAGCQPFEANWDKLSHPDYQCINTSNFYVAQGAIGAFLDISILLLPIPAVWNLSLKTRKKIALTFVFTIGIVICAISLTRLAYNTQQTYMLTHFAEYAGIAALLGALEINLTIICACLPTLPTLVSGLVEKIRTSLHSLYSKRYRSTRPTEDSIQLDPPPSDLRRGYRSSHKIGHQDAHSGKIHDRLYPLIRASETRGSFEAHDVEGGRMESATGMHVGQAHFQAWRGDMNSAGADHGQGIEPYSTISVTKSWGVK